MARNRLLLYAVLQILPLLILPPSMLFSATGINLGSVFMLVTLIVVFALLGWGLLRGREWALTLSILLQGMNVIVRLMMVFPNAVSKQGVWDIALIIAFLVSIGVSAWFMMRLDRPDIRSMVSA